MDMTTIAAAQASIKAVLGLAQGATSAAVDHQLKERLINIQTAILDTQAKLGHAQAERLDLLNQVAELKAVIRDIQKSGDALGAYTLHAIEPGRFVYKYKDETGDGVPHFACPTCHNGGKVTVLQVGKSGKAQQHYVCKTCQFQMYVGPSDPAPPMPRRVSHWSSY